MSVPLLYRQRPHFDPAAVGRLDPAFFLKLITFRFFLLGKNEFDSRSDFNFEHFLLVAFYRS